MNIFMTTDTVGGVWTYALELARGLVRQGHRIFLATLGPPMTAAQGREAVGCCVKVWEGRFKLEWMDGFEEDFGPSSLWLRDLADRSEADLVHLNQFAYGALDWGRPALVVGHSCVFSWWEAVRGGRPPGRRWEGYRRLVRHGLQGAEAVAAPSRFMLEQLRRHYGGLPTGRVVPNGRNFRSFTPSAKQPEVLAVGRVWDEAKNIRLLDEAAEGLERPVTVIGQRQGPEGQEVPLRNVQCAGVMGPEQVARRLGRASIYCLPARYEPFGLSALEAGLCGCALVLGDTPSLREVWGPEAVYVDPDDPRSLHDVLRELLQEPSLCRDLGQRARRRARRYTLEAMARGYHTLYEERTSSTCAL